MSLVHRCCFPLSIAIAALVVLAGVPGAPPGPDVSSPARRAGGGEPGTVYHSPTDVILGPDGALAYVINEESDTISVLDVAARRIVREIPVGPRPTHAVFSPDGSLMWVSCRYGSCVKEMRPADGSVTRTLPAGYEPWGLALSSDGRTLFVANSLSNTVSFLDLETGRARAEIPVGTSPHYLALTPDGRRLVVANGRARHVTILDASTGAVLESRPLGRANLMRQLACSPDGRHAYVAHILSHDEVMTLQMERGWIHSNGFTILDLETPGRYVTLLLDEVVRGAANPWGVALSSDGSRLYVTLAGVHEVAYVDVPKALALAAATTRPLDVTRLSQNVEIVSKRGIARRFPAGGLGPRGLALVEDRDELLVADYFSDAVSILDATTGERKALVPLGPPQEMTLWRKGQLLFNDARFCFQNWFCCASCHQEDATVDGLNWDLANDGLGNPKNVKSLHDVVDTPPAMWHGVREDIDAAVQAGQRFLGFLPETTRHPALIRFLSNPPRAPNPYRTRDPEALARGERVFRKARCHVCHPAPKYTDLRTHDIEFANPVDLRTRFDTPSLRECYRTGPYLHDGRAATLREIFTKHNPKDLHGRTRGLSEAEIDDLVEFLRSL